MMRSSRITALLLATQTACSTTAPITPEPTRPFIKLANRQISLVLFWRAPAPTPGYREGLERALARRIRATYRVDPLVHNIFSAPSSIPPDLLLEMVKRSVDDIIIVDLGSKAQSALFASGAVQVLTTGETAASFSAGTIRGRATGLPEVERVADILVLGLTERWTDPGAAPALDSIALAKRLADQGDCRRAEPIYRAELPQRRARTIVDIQTITEARSRFERCTEQLAVEAILAKDRSAKFDLHLKTEALSEPVISALQLGLRKSNGKARLRALTHKPVTILAAPGSLILSMRYHPERYQEATRTAPPLREGQPVLHLEPFVPAMSILFDVKTYAMEALPPLARATLARFRVVLRLEKLPRQRVDVDFAELDGRVLLPNSVRMQIEPQQEFVVESTIPDVTRSRQIVLGDPTTPGGAVTSYGLLYDFFELRTL